MPTQDSKFPAIPFSLAEPLQHVRLLEVPEELLDIIVNTKENLYFKSAAPAASLNTSIEGKEGNLHLCTENKVWAVKQVSTSNSIHVTRTCLTGETIDDADNKHDDEEMDLDDVQDGGTSELGISAFAKPTSILELHALHPATYETIVQEHLNNLVPTLSSTEDLTVSRPSNNYSLRELYDHIPAPTSVIQRVLAQKCIFEIPQPSSQPSNGNTSKVDTYIPSPSLLLSTWTEIVNTAILNGKDITRIENINILANEGHESSEILDDTNTPEEHFTRSLHKSLSTRLFDSQGHLASLGIMNQEAHPQLNARECTRWVGNLILASTDTTSHPTRSAFEKDWEDRVPADWIKYCSIEVLQPSCEVTTADDQEVIKWVPFTLEGDGVGKNGNAKESASQLTGTIAAPVAKNKRKWHEKFAAQRDAKK